MTTTDIALRDLTLSELACDPSAAELVARFTRDDEDEPTPLQVASFQSFIDGDQAAP